MGFSFICILMVFWSVGWFVVFVIAAAVADAAGLDVAVVIVLVLACLF